MAAHDRQATRDRRLQQSNKALVLEAFETLFNRRDFGTAERWFSPTYIQHSAQVPAGLKGLFDLVRTLPTTFRYEPGLIVAEGDFVMLHGRYSGYGLPRRQLDRCRHPACRSRHFGRALGRFPGRGHPPNDQERTAEVE